MVFISSSVTPFLDVKIMWNTDMKMSFLDLWLKLKLSRISETPSEEKQDQTDEKVENDKKAQEDSSKSETKDDKVSI